MLYSCTEAMFNLHRLTAFACVSQFLCMILLGVALKWQHMLMINLFGLILIGKVVLL